MGQASSRLQTGAAQQLCSSAAQQPRSRQPQGLCTTWAWLGRQEGHPGEKEEERNQDIFNI